MRLAKLIVLSFLWVGFTSNFTMRSMAEDTVEETHRIISLLPQSKTAEANSCTGTLHKQQKKKEFENLFFQALKNGALLTVSNLISMDPTIVNKTFFNPDFKTDELPSVIIAILNHETHGNGFKLLNILNKKKADFNVQTKCGAIPWPVTPLSLLVLGGKSFENFIPTFISYGANPHHLSVTLSLGMATFYYGEKYYNHMNELLCAFYPRIHGTQSKL